MPIRPLETRVSENAANPVFFFCFFIASTARVSRRSARRVRGEPSVGARGRPDRGGIGSLSPRQLRRVAVGGPLRAAIASPSHRPPKSPPPLPYYGQNSPRSPPCAVAERRRRVDGGRRRRVPPEVSHDACWRGGRRRSPFSGLPARLKLDHSACIMNWPESYDRIDSASSSSTDPMPRRQDFSVCCKTFRRRQGDHSRRCELDNPRSARAAAGAFERTLRACMARRGSPLSLGRQANSQDFTSRKSCSRPRKKPTRKKKTEDMHSVSNSKTLV